MADALVCVVVVILICEICFNVCMLIDKHEVGMMEYLDRQNEAFQRIFLELGECMPCRLEEDE